MSLDPIGNTLWVHLQLAPNPPQVHAIHIELNGLPPRLSTVAMCLLDGSVLATTPIAAISLAAGSGLADLMLFVATLASGTFHSPILPTILGTPYFSAIGALSLLSSDRALKPVR